LSNLQEITSILTSVDGSEPSINAANYAISAAKVYSAKLIALHVIPSDLSLFGPSPPPHLEELKKVAQEYLDKVTQKAQAINSGIQVKTNLIASPSVVGGIVNFAEQEHVNLIVIGTKGRSGIKKLLLGSVASGVVTYAHCPVMVVK
jgi:nucleotide-binding universal stress UspA family protein